VIREELALETDGAALAGTLTLPDGEGLVSVVVGVHGAEGGTRSFHLFRHLETTLPSGGVATLLFDRRGDGASTGDGAGVSYEVFAADVRAWLRRCAADERIDSDRIGLWGISQGGCIAPLAADEAVEEMLALRRAMDELSAGRLTVVEAQALLDAATGKEWFQFAFVPPHASVIDGSWAEEMEFDIRALRKLDLPVLLFFGEHDRWIPVAESADAWRAELGPGADLTVVSLPGTGHAATFAADPADWLERGPLSADYQRALLTWLHERGLVGAKGA
jgi:uncharacterized protein